MVDENGIELPALARPWVNLVSKVGLPLVLLSLILWAGYAGGCKVATWTAPKIEEFIKEHRDLVDTIQKNNIQNQDNIKQLTENNSKLATLHEQTTLILGSVDKHLESTDRRLEHIEQTLSDVKK